MDTEKIVLERKEARELWRAYQTHRHYSAPIDREIARTYQLIAQGRLVIKARESITAAGLNAERLPKLALVRADAKHCECVVYGNGGARFEIPGRRNGKGTFFEFAAGSFPAIEGPPSEQWQHTKRGRAIVPLVPLEHRPKRGVENYSILWEADWKEVPVDPMLLRQIGKGDLWLVVAAWDLTEIERTALAARVRA